MIKSPEEIAKMRIAGRLAASVLEMITPYVRPGVTTGELERICRRYIVEDLEAVPSTLGQTGFPACICTSVNHVVCHGIPHDRKLFILWVLPEQSGHDEWLIKSLPDRF